MVQDHSERITTRLLIMIALLAISLTPFYLFIWFTLPHNARYRGVATATTSR